MADEKTAAPEGEQTTTVVEGETIASEMPNRSPDDTGGNTTSAAARAEGEPENEAADAAPAEPEGESEADPGEGDPDGKPDKPKMDWRERRRIEETNKRKAAEQERDRLKAELEALKKGTPPAEGQPDTTAQPTAEQLREQAKREAREELEREQSERAFNEATGRVLNNGLQAYPDFEQARQEMVQNFGEQLSQRRDFFDAITEIPNGHDVFYALAKDPEQAEQVLSMSPTKLAIHVAKMSDTLSKPAPKPVSKVPPPVSPVGGTAAGTTRLEDENAPMDAWAGKFLKQMAGRGR